jgi:hypothetical protein
MFTYMCRPFYGIAITDREMPIRWMKVKTNEHPLPEWA